MGRSILVIFFGALSSILLIPPSPEQHWIVPIGLGVISVISGLFFQKSIDDFLKSKKGWVIGSFFCAGITFFITLWAGVRQLGGFDHSALIDTAWRMYQGQMPYQDFPCSLPPGFFLGASWAFWFFGPHWFSLILMNALYGVASFTWSCWLLKKIEGPSFSSLLLACFLQAVTTVLVAYWWYNPITTIAAILFFLSAVFFLHESECISGLFSYLSSLVLLILMKPNIAGIEIAGITTVLLLSRKLAFKTVLLSLSGVGIFVGIFISIKINISDLFASYLAISGRAFTFHQFLQDLGTLEKSLTIVLWMMIFFVIVAAVVRAPNLKNQQWLACVLLLAGIFGSITNGENKLCDLPLIVFAAWFLTKKENELSCIDIRQLNFSYRRMLVLLLCFLTGLGLGEGILRHRVMQIGQEKFFQYQTSKEKVSGSFFENFHASPLFVQLHQELTHLMFCLNKNESVWFGPRMQWAYADFDILSPIDQPIWWHAGVSYPSSKERYFVDSWKDKHFDVLVFFRNDITYLPQELLAAIRENYILVSNQGLLTVLHRNTSTLKNQ